MWFHRSIPRALLLLVTHAVLPHCLAAQDDEADHEALREIRAVAEEAINTNQLDLFQPHLSDNFSIVTYTDREFSDFGKFKQRWQQTRDEVVGGGSYQTTMNPVRSRIFGDIAVAQGNSDNVLVNDSGERFEFTSHWTAVLHQEDGKWKVIRAHSSLSPFDNPMLVSGVQTKLWQIGGAAGLVGLAVGCLVGWLWGKRRAAQNGAKPVSDPASTN